MSKKLLAWLATPALVLGSVLLVQAPAQAADEDINGCTIIEFPTAAVHTDCGIGWSPDGASLAGRDLRWAELRGVNLAGVDLSGADLTDAYLYEANLAGADLSGATLDDAEMRFTLMSDANLANAQLRRADLFESDLRRANLVGVDLTDAELRGANLSDTNLSLATLVDAYLYEADLTRANLSGADLTGAELRFTSLVDADLTGTDMTLVQLEGADVTGSTLMPDDIHFTIPATEADALVAWTRTLPTGVRPPGCTPASGSSFAVGSHVVTCTFRTDVSSGGLASGTFSVTVDQAAPVAITSGAPAAGIIDEAYEHQITATGDPTLPFYLTDGVLPPGLDLDRDTGLISGTPTEAGTWTYTVRTANDFGADEQVQTITIAGPVDDDDTTPVGDDDDTTPVGGDDDAGGSIGGAIGGSTGGSGTTTASGTSAGLSAASGEQVLPNVGAGAQASMALSGLVLPGLGAALLHQARRPRGLLEV